MNNTLNKPVNFINKPGTRKESLKEDDEPVDFKYINHILSLETEARSSKMLRQLAKYL